MRSRSKTLATSRWIQRCAGSNATATKKAAPTVAYARVAHAESRGCDTISAKTAAATSVVISQAADSLSSRSTSNKSYRRIATVTASGSNTSMATMNPANAAGHRRPKPIGHPAGDEQNRNRARAQHHPAQLQPSRGIAAPVPDHDRRDPEAEHGKQAHRRHPEQAGTDRIRHLQWRCAR